MRRLAFAAFVALLAGCSHHHHARVTSPPSGPPAVQMIPHSGRLWVELEGTPDRQCERSPAERELCFSGVRDALGAAFEKALWPAFPHVAVKRKGDDVEPGDYLLHVRLRLDSRPADAEGPGHSARAQAAWQLVRDGLPLAGQSVSARSRGDFAYGRSLGIGAGESVEAIAQHVATVVGTLPELRPPPKRTLPEVVTRSATGLLTRDITSTEPTASAASR